jgi:elongation factor Ts
MAEITPALVGKLREMTNAGLMNCKNALVEAGGDIDKAVDILRKKGAATAVTKAGREAKDGLIAQTVAQGGKVGVLVEINCETDFVARNDSFKEFCNGIAATIAVTPNADLEPARVAAVGKTGENVQIRRFQRLETQGIGALAAYIHTGGKVGVMVEIGASKESTIAAEEFKQLLRDITLQIAAASPIAVGRADVPAAAIEKEREIASQSEALKNKPPQAIAKIIEGKLSKFFETACLLEQGFVKNPDLKVEAHVGSVAKHTAEAVAFA